MEIVFELKRIPKGDLPGYYFGRERYGIECDKNICIITDEYTDVELKRGPFRDIYDLVKAWKSYYAEWEKTKEYKVDYKLVYLI